MASDSKNTVPHAEALARLKAGNDRFVADIRATESISTAAQRQALVKGQTPFAILLACSDSRVPAEMVFDCGLGDLFVVRVAGNVVAPSIIGSVEFAAATFGSQLVVVMGHTHCGAIKSTIGALSQGHEAPSDNIRDIVERISPSVAELVEAKLSGDALLRAATRANIRASASHLRHGSRLLETLVSSGRLNIVSAEYDLESGRVTFLDEA